MLIQCRRHASQADKFHKTGKQLRSKMWWQNMRLKIVVVVVVLVRVLTPNLPRLCLRSGASWLTVPSVELLGTFACQPS